MLLLRGNYMAPTEPNAQFGSVNKHVYKHGAPMELKLLLF